MRRAKRLKRSARWFLYAGAAILIVIVPIGCATSSSGASDHEEEAHAFPPHWPGTFTTAVSQLPNRWAALEKRSFAPAEQLSELTDIIRWIPELAGDSDLGKKDWEQVLKLSAELERLLARSALKAESNSSLNLERDAAIKELQRLAEESQSSKAAVWRKVS